MRSMCIWSLLQDIPEPIKATICIYHSTRLRDCVVDIMEHLLAVVESSMPTRTVDHGSKSSKHCKNSKVFLGSGHSMHDASAS